MKVISFSVFLAAWIGLSTNAIGRAQSNDAELATPDTSVLNEHQWRQLDDSVKRGLSWLANQQQPDGSFDSLPPAQPAVTALSLMAFLAQGETPASGKYQQQLSSAIDYIIAQQKDNGLLATRAPNINPIPRNVDHTIGQPAVYNHAISALALAEAYGQCSPAQAKKLTPVIENAIAATLQMQRWTRKAKPDIGGWRYLSKPHPEDSDLSITGWQLAFLRSARNSGFDVPKKSVDQGVAYIENCFHKEPNRQVFGYMTTFPDACTRAMAGAGVLALAHAGKHDSPAATKSGDWILKRGFRDYNDDTPPYGVPWLVDRYHYGCVICTQAMFQLGGKYWKQFFPPLMQTLLANQQPNGAWPPERKDERYGSCYSTALCVLSLSVPNQILPIFQR